jgi:ABC-type polysaccharide/polyol phosphate transport system ATPase subunit
MSITSSTTAGCNVTRISEILNCLFVNYSNFTNYDSHSEHYISSLCDSCSWLNGGQVSLSV